MLLNCESESKINFQKDVLKLNSIDNKISRFDEIKHNLIKKTQIIGDVLNKLEEKERKIKGKIESLTNINKTNIIDNVAYNRYNQV